MTIYKFSSLTNNQQLERSEIQLCWTITNNRSRGSITAPLLIISSTFIVVIYGLLFMITTQFENVERQTQFDQALSIAEAGINYYRWHLAHAPNDYQDGTGQPGPYLHNFKDAQGKELGFYELLIDPPANGSFIITIRSTGWTNQNPEIKRTVIAQYGIPSLTKYSFLSNASNWYGEGITVHGRIHSNNGIRMDGINTSIVSSSMQEYQCGSETGCSPTQKKPGVWGVGPNYSMWQYPVSSIDFDAVFFDLALMKDNAIASGVYLQNSKSEGYHLVFKANGTVDIYKVTQTNSFHGYTSHEGCRRLNQDIRRESFVASYSTSDKHLFFIEDQTWVDGVINGTVTIAAAQFPLQSNNTNIIINNNLTYLAKDGKHALGMVAHNDIIMGRDIPTNYEIDGALMAQEGKVIRHGYLDHCGDSPNAVRNSLTIYGSILSNQKSYWNYGTAPDSGFVTRTITYDANLLYAPPPYFPTDGEYEFISWKEE